MADLQLPQSREHETTRVMLRRHPATFAWVLLRFVVLLVVPIAIFAISASLRDHIAQADALGIALVLGAACYLLFVGLLLLHSWLLYYLDVWFVTNQRVVSELPLDQIQDITVEVRGILPTMLHYGDIIVQTAGETPRFCLDNIPNPQAVAHLIMEQRQHAQGGVQNKP